MTSILVKPGPFNAPRLVSAALAVLASDVNECNVRQSSEFSPDVEWIFGLELPEGCEGRPGRWYTYAPTKTSNEDTAQVPQYMRDGDVIPLATCGMLWRDHGLSILGRLATDKEIMPQVNEDGLLTLHRKLYENTFQALDARDLRIQNCELCTQTMFLNWTTFDKMMMFKDPSTVLGVSNAPSALEERRNAFNRAVADTVDILVRSISGLAWDWLPALEVVQRSLEGRAQYKQGNVEVMLLERFVPWREHLYQLEESMGLITEDSQIRWIIFQDDRSGQWRGTAPAKKGDRFANRALIHEDLRGLRDAELVEKSRIEGANFVHHSGFTGGASTLEAMLALLAYQGCCQ